MKYWLMKAEPESRLVKGKDVKVSVANLSAIVAQRPIQSSNMALSLV